MYYSMVCAEQHLSRRSNWGQCPNSNETVGNFTDWGILIFSMCISIFKNPISSKKDNLWPFWVVLAHTLSHVEARCLHDATPFIGHCWRPPELYSKMTKAFHENEDILSETRAHILTFQRQHHAALSRFSIVHSTLSWTRYFSSTMEGCAL